MYLKEKKIIEPHSECMMWIYWSGHVYPTIIEEAPFRSILKLHIEDILKHQLVLDDVVHVTQSLQQTAPL